MIGALIFRLHRLARILVLKLADLYFQLVYSISLEKMGKGSRIQRSVWITDPKRVTLGARCEIKNGVNIYSEHLGSLKIEDDVQINRFAKIDYTGGLCIGQGTLVSEGAVIYTHSHGLNPRETCASRGTEPPSV